MTAVATPGGGPLVRGQSPKKHRAQDRHQPAATRHGSSPPGRSWPLAGAASLGMQALIDGPERPARVVAAFPAAVYLELRGPGPEPRVLALVTPAAVRLPNAVVVTPPAASDPRGRANGDAAAATPRARHGDPGPLIVVATGDEARVGDGGVAAGRVRVQVQRWWDPAPVLGPLSRARLDHGCTLLEDNCGGSARRPGLDGHAGPAALAAHCAAGNLADAVEVAEELVGLGPGLTPSGDDMLAGLLLALRLLGGAIRGGTRAVWLADWLGAAVTCYATDRTTALSATLLHCAARGQASAEVATVLRAFAGQEPAGAAVTRLLATGHTSGADLAWGLAAGCRAALALSADPRG